MEGFLFECTKLREITPWFVHQCFEWNSYWPLHQLQLSSPCKDPGWSSQVPWGQGRPNLSKQQEEAGIVTPGAGVVHQWLHKLHSDEVPTSETTSHTSAYCWKWQAEGALPPLYQWADTICLLPPGNRYCFQVFQHTETVPCTSELCIPSCWEEELCAIWDPNVNICTTRKWAREEWWNMHQLWECRVGFELLVRLVFGFGLDWLFARLALSWASSGLGWFWAGLVLSWVGFRLGWLGLGWVGLGWVGFGLGWLWTMQVGRVGSGHQTRLTLSRVDFGLGWLLSRWALCWDGFFFCWVGFACSVSPIALTLAFSQYLCGLHASHILVYAPSLFSRVPPITSVYTFSQSSHGISCTTRFFFSQGIQFFNCTRDCLSMLGDLKAALISRG